MGLTVFRGEAPANATNLYNHERRKRFEKGLGMSIELANEIMDIHMPDMDRSNGPAQERIENGD